MPLSLLKGIRHYKNNGFKKDEDLLTDLSRGQRPGVLLFNCIDSRTDLRSVTNAKPGEILIDRNPGNIIPPYSSSVPSGAASSLEFALMHLNVGEIIVCGHSHCGAMKGLLTPGIEKDLPSTAAWISHARPALDYVNKHYPQLKDNCAQQLEYVTQQNIRLQMEHLRTHPAVLRRLAEGNLKIHGWYYEFEKGEIYIYNAKNNKFISFEETVKEISQEKLKQIVQEVALNYLNNLTPVINTGHNVLLERYKSLNQLTSIWKHIEAEVRYKVEEELGELYLTSDGSFSSEFNELLNEGHLVQVSTTHNKYQQIEHLFNQALNYNHLSDKQKKLLDIVSRLKEYTLRQFAACNEHASFNNCMLLAENTMNLMSKIMNNNAKLSDVALFKDIIHCCNSIFSSSPKEDSEVITDTVMADVSELRRIGMWGQTKNPVLQFTMVAENIIDELQETCPCCFI